MSMSLNFFFSVTFTGLKSGYTCLFTLDFVPSCHKTLETHEKAVPRKPFLVKFVSTNINPKV